MRSTRTFARGELRVLTWGDIDLDVGRIHVTKAWDYEANEVKPPKSDAGVRYVPIELSLRPLLERMRQGKKRTDVVVPCLAAYGEDHLAQLFRKHLLAAKVTRAELHASTRTHVQANFRSCRDSGITWLALTGLDATKIERRAGHEKIDTTDGYIKMAEDLGGEFGEPFAALPESLTACATCNRRSANHQEITHEFETIKCRRRESNPRLRPIFPRRNQRLVNQNVASKRLSTTRSVRGSRGSRRRRGYSNGSSEATSACS